MTDIATLKAKFETAAAAAHAADLEYTTLVEIDADFDAIDEAYNRMVDNELRMDRAWETYHEAATVAGIVIGG